ncbi:cupredoxin family copper-binding protein [Frigidibacter sp. RF13]|uniref:cupredoxin domain-containing protein n=1 Tax=Frigidibacter sp. RF13 TaxID=2997340 RepID=UPI00226FCD38|nr:cupredoxin family copper-binding protein [Frigidibacter sp. RF13]MCY1125747.1 cupredoxin family copper-binding protein [Frigidibacter sp. RF13]
MRGLTPLSRRRFGQGLGAALTLAGLPRVVSAHDGPHVAEVRIMGFAYQPRVLEILAGDSVVWRNEDIAPHTASAADGSWDTGAIEKGESAEMTFDRPGEFAYVCAFHTHMKATVKVMPKG